MIPLPYLALAFVVACAGSYATGRYHGTHSEREAWQLQEAKAALKSQKQATAIAEIATAEVTDYVDQVREDAPVVERVVERVRNVCLRPADPDRVPVPAPARAADAAALAAQNARNREAEDAEYIAAIQSDLASCANDLARFSALQAFAEKASAGVVTP